MPEISLPMDISLNARTGIHLRDKITNRMDKEVACYAKNKEELKE